MKHRNSHLLVGYWSRIRRDRRVPDQTDIDPRAIKRMLSNVFILDARDVTFPVYRLAGTALCERFALELKGINFLTLWEARAKETLGLLLGQSLAGSMPICLSAMGETAQRTMIEMETVMAPLGFRSTGPQRFLGMTQFLGDCSQLGSWPIALQRLMGSKMIRESDPAGMDLDPPPPPSFESRAAKGRAPHLRLVVSRDTPPLHCELDKGMRGAIEAFGFPSETGPVR